MLYKRQFSAFAAAALMLPFMSGPAYSLSLAGRTFPLSGTGSFAYDCASNNPVGSTYTFDDIAYTFRANAGPMTCIFTLDTGGTVTVPFNLDVTYYNANIVPDGDTTTVTDVCPTGTYVGSFHATGPCVGDPDKCAAWSSQLPGGEFHFQTPWVGAPTGQISRICAATFPATADLPEDVMASWSVTSVPGETNATAPQFRFCATPIDPATGEPEPCTETIGKGQDKHLYLRGAAGTAEIRIIGDAQVVNTWNANNPQQGNLNVKYLPTAQLDPHNFKDIFPVGPDGPRVEGVLANSCSDGGTYIQCSFPSAQLAPIVQNRIVNNQVSLTGTAETNGGTAVIFFMIANVSNGGS